MLHARQFTPWLTIVEATGALPGPLPWLGHPPLGSGVLVAMAHSPFISNNRPWPVEGKLPRGSTVDLFCGLPSELFQDPADSSSLSLTHVHMSQALRLGALARDTASQINWCVHLCKQSG